MSKLPVREFWKHLNNAKLVRYLLLFALAWAIVQLLAYFQTVLVIFIFAAILAFLLNYPVRWLERWLPHGAAGITVFLLSIIILGGAVVTLGSAIVSQGQQLVSQSPELIDTLLPLVGQIERLLEQWNIQVDFSTVEEQLQEQAIAGIGIGLATLQQMLTNLVDVILIAVVSFFMLLDGERLWNFVMKVFPAEHRDDVTTSIQANFLGFFWGRLLLSTFFAGSCFIVFVVLQVPYPLLLAAIAGVFDLIPGIGATLGVILVALIVLPQGIWLSVQVIVICILLQQVEENLLMPRIMQGSINMNPVVLFLALLIGARVAGLFGIFLAIPIAGVVISLLNLEDLKGSK
ncbi:AI-2E family transporter [Oculatella sp. LEGE 06141]|uniref:AI-2E family transporter n=1 Tax=Oculatella sp. LEGE 06141 TaxID=1828648 RepID=UPI001881478D|nr:AI-2E family transporter [Oculatella sp. LEGE 06141]MBE9182647.1 AI-2E family transporter [Oculatella sp. LEGE 06141]